MKFTSRLDQFFPFVLFFSWTAILCLTLWAQDESNSTTPSFRPRSDLRAEQDTQALRLRLSTLRDTQGPINPLADYVQRSHQSSKKERDLESESKPTLKSPAKGYRSLDQGPTDTDPSSSAGSISLLPGPVYTIAYTPAGLSRSDGFVPWNSQVDLESQRIPTLGASTLVSANRIPAAWYPTLVTSNYQGPELPGGAGGIPGTFGTPNIPSAAPVLPNMMGTNPATSAPIYPPNMVNPGAMNPGAAVTNPILPNSAIPGAALPPPGSMASPTSQVPNVIANPLPGTTPATVTGPSVPGTIMPGNIMPGTTIPAPPPYYPAPTQPSGVSGVVPNAIPSPSDSTLPRYPRTAPIVNGAPFVSSPPCQFDASYMVSPRVYRPANDCCSTGYTNPPYASSPTGSPFTYVPPTSMPGVYRNPPFPILIGFGQNLNNAYLSRGIFGQPKAYMDGQPVRNFLRYLLP